MKINYVNSTKWFAFQLFFRFIFPYLYWKKKPSTCVCACMSGVTTEIYCTHKTEKLLSLLLHQRFKLFNFWLVVQILIKNRNLPQHNLIKKSSVSIESSKAWRQGPCPETLYFFICYNFFHVIFITVRKLKYVYKKNTHT